MFNEGCLVSRNIYPLGCTAGTRKSYVTNRFSFTLPVHISYAYELPCRSIIIPYRESSQTEKMLSVFRLGTYALSLAHLRGVMAALSILAFLLRSRRLCTRHPFLFNCEHQFSLVQLHYSNRKSHCQHLESRITARVLLKCCPLFPYSIFRSFECFLVVNILQKIFSKKFLITINLAFSGVNLPHVAIKKKRRVFTRLSKHPP